VPKLRKGAEKERKWLFA